METQKFLGRHQIVDRLTAQVGDRDLAIGILIKNGLMTEDGKLTAKGKARNAMTAEERAVDRAVARSGKSHADYVYDPRTNRATLRKR